MAVVMHVEFTVPSDIDATDILEYINDALGNLRTQVWYDGERNGKVIGWGDKEIGDFSITE